MRGPGPGSLLGPPSPPESLSVSRSIQGAASERAAGVATALQDVVGPVVLVFALVTQLGDLWLLALVATLAYWLDAKAPLVGHGLDRKRTGLVLALLVGAVVLLLVLKPLFALERPPGFERAPYHDLVPGALRGLYHGATTASGYGFPSGHALGATIVWGGLAWAVRVGQQRIRVTAAVAVVGLVSVSRLILGVHYLVDVLAGITIGLVYLAVVLRVLRTPLAGFLAASTVAILGAVLAAGGVLTGGYTPELATAVGLSLGTTVTWATSGETLRSARSRGTGAATTGLGTVVVAPTVASPILFDSVIVCGLLATIGGTLLVAWPLVARRLVDG